MQDFKKYKDVKCELCGETATEFDGGVAGICAHCGNEWGGWEHYEDDIVDEPEVTVPSENIIEKTNELGLTAIEVSKDDYEKTFESLSDQEGKLLIPEIVLSKRIGKEKPTDVISTFWISHTSEFYFLQRVHIFIFENDLSKPELKVAYAVKFDDMHQFEKYYAIIMAKSIEKAGRILKRLEIIK